MKRLTYAAVLVAVLVSSSAAGTFAMFTDGPLTNLMSLRGRTDENGYLRVSGGAVGATDGPLTALANLRGRTDENGYLRVALDGLTPTQGTITSDAQAISTTATWNSAGTTFTHWLANVTDTASASASKLLDLQVGGTSKFKVEKTGNTEIAPSAYIYWTGRNYLDSPSNGRTRINNAAGTNTYDITLADWGTTLSGEAVSYANGTATLLAASVAGYYTVCDNDGGCAIYGFSGGGGGTAEVNDLRGRYTVTKDNAGTANIYYDAAGASGAGYYLQNNMTTRTFRFAGFGG